MQQAGRAVCRIDIRPATKTYMQMRSCVDLLLACPEPSPLAAAAAAAALAALSAAARFFISTRGGVSTRR